MKVAWFVVTVVFALWLLLAWGCLAQVEASGPAFPPRPENSGPVWGMQNWGGGGRSWGAQPYMGPWTPQAGWTGGSNWQLSPFMPAAPLGRDRFFSYGLFPYSPLFSDNGAAGYVIPGAPYGGWN